MKHKHDKNTLDSIIESIASGWYSVWDTLDISIYIFLFIIFILLECALHVLHTL